MSLSGLLVAVAEHVAGVIVEDCGLAQPDQLLIYHARPSPEDCCSDAGVLSVWWADAHPSINFPRTSVLDKDQCAASPVYTVGIRYVTCWPVPEATEAGIVVSQPQDDAWSIAAETLADVADCVARALLRLQCAITGTGAADDLLVTEQAVVAEVGRKGWFRLLDTTPTLPSGACAGVQWRIYATPAVEMAS